MAHWHQNFLRKKPEAAESKPAEAVTGPLVCGISPRSSNGISNSHRLRAINIQTGAIV